MSTDDSTLFQAEQAVLCAMLSESEECIPRVQKLLPASEFQGQAHRSIASAMYALHSEGVVVDPLTLIAKLEKHDVLQAVGGKDYIGYLIDCYPTAANVMAHARLIRQDGDRRRTISYLVNAVDGLKSGKLNLRELAVEAQAVLLPLALEEDGRGFVWIQNSHVQEVLAELDRRAHRIEEGLLPGIPTGYHQIDRVTQGFRLKEFVIFGGRDKSLKSYLVQNILVNLALGRIHGGLVSAEMAFGEALERFLGTASLTGVYDMARGSITASERERIIREGSKIENYLAIDDEATPELGDVIARCTELKAHQPRLQVLAVDYIQLVQNRMAGRRGDEEINVITRAFKGMAKRLDVVLIAVAQCNHKDLETRQDKRPQIRDFQGASGMAQDADFRGMLYKDDEYNPGSPPTLEINFSGRRCGKFDVLLDYDTKSLAIYEKQKPAARAIA
jgi:replicative DNA helicase